MAYGLHLGMIQLCSGPSVVEFSNSFCTLSVCRLIFFFFSIEIPDDEQIKTKLLNKPLLKL